MAYRGRLIAQYRLSAKAKLRIKMVVVQCKCKLNLQVGKIESEIVNDPRQVSNGSTLPKLG